MSSISSHVLDTGRGIPAEGIEVTLQVQSSGAWNDLVSAKTNADGRVGKDQFSTYQNGLYRMHFDLTAYYEQHPPANGYFYPYVDITFKIAQTGQHYHIPLLLNPYGYTTYRGS